MKSIVRARGWQRLLESGCYASLTELVAAAEINQSYMRRVLRLTLAPETVLDERPPEGTTLPGLMKPIPEEWQEQGPVMIR